MQKKHVKYNSDKLNINCKIHIVIQKNYKAVKKLNCTSLIEKTSITTRGAK